MARLLGCSKAEAVCAVANIFLGQTDAPILLRAATLRPSRPPSNPTPWRAA